MRFGGDELSTLSSHVGFSFSHWLCLLGVELELCSTVHYS